MEVDFYLRFGGCVTLVRNLTDKEIKVRLEYEGEADGREIKHVIEERIDPGKEARIPFMPFPLKDLPERWDFSITTYARYFGEIEWRKQALNRYTVRPIPPVGIVPPPPEKPPPFETDEEIVDVFPKYVTFGVCNFTCRPVSALCAFRVNAAWQFLSLPNLPCTVPVSAPIESPPGAYDWDVYKEMTVDWETVDLNETFIRSAERIIVPPEIAPPPVKLPPPPKPFPTAIAWGLTLGLIGLVGIAGIAKKKRKF